jgi:hypothetical protein
LTKIIFTRLTDVETTASESGVRPNHPGPDVAAAEQGEGDRLPLVQIREAALGNP